MNNIEEYIFKNFYQQARIRTGDIVQDAPDKNVNPAFQRTNNEDGFKFYPLDDGEYRIFVLTETFSLNVGIKNQVNDQFEKTFIELGLYTEDNLKGLFGFDPNSRGPAFRTGHPSIVFGEDLFCAGYLLQRPTHLEVFFNSGRFRNRELDNSILKYLAYLLQKKYSLQDIYLYIFREGRYHPNIVRDFNEDLRMWDSIKDDPQVFLVKEFSVVNYFVMSIIINSKISLDVSTFEKVYLYLEDFVTTTLRDDPELQKACSSWKYIVSEKLLEDDPFFTKDLKNMEAICAKKADILNKHRDPSYKTDTEKVFEQLIKTDSKLKSRAFRALRKYPLQKKLTKTITEILSKAVNRELSPHFSLLREQVKEICAIKRGIDAQNEALAREKKIIEIRARVNEENKAKQLDLEKLKEAEEKDRLERLIAQKKKKNSNTIKIKIDQLLTKKILDKINEIFLGENFKSGIFRPSTEEHYGNLYKLLQQSNSFDNSIGLLKRFLSGNMKFDYYADKLIKENDKNKRFFLFCKELNAFVEDLLTLITLDYEDMLEIEKEVEARRFYRSISELAIKKESLTYPKKIEEEHSLMREPRINYKIEEERESRTNQKFEWNYKEVQERNLYKELEIETFNEMRKFIIEECLEEILKNYEEIKETKQLNLSNIEAFYIPDKKDEELVVEKGKIYIRCYFYTSQDLIYLS
ncbi:hypothetical protein [Francisella frigiditurris]|uniref:Uncharacterized protein n=1 Tax=Francisella frigiditurris TaxID=1542390 RepID=A0A1J0KRT3_9GAMM|nr:hypothetical protein [Francisella frigiditurris]APC96457.1 hypothetical protein KX01_319 [Francisella frigiditurris]